MQMKFGPIAVGATSIQRVSADKKTFQFALVTCTTQWATEIGCRWCVQQSAQLFFALQMVSKEQVWKDR